MVLWPLFNYGLFKLFEAGVWHPFNSKAILGGAGGSGHTLARYAEWNKSEMPDILIMGSSHAYRAWDTRILAASNIQAFNMGTTSQSPMNTYYLLKDLLKRKPTPKVLLLDVFPPLLAQKQGIESAIDLNTNLPISIHLIEMNFQLEGILAEHHLLATAVDRVFTPYSQLKQKKIANDNYCTGGYVQSSMEPVPQNENLPNDLLHGWETDPRQLEYLTKCIRKAKESGMQVVLISQPQQAMVTQLPSYKDGITMVKQIAKQERCNYFDCSNLGDSLPLDYIDWHHLDSTSVEMYNRHMISDSAFLANMFK
jgi:hypothetical protein